MPSNIEVKIRVPDLAVIRAAALAAGACVRGIERQVDRYYELDGRRRVKLRSRDGGPAELIRYERPEIDGVRASHYEITPVRDDRSRACLVPKSQPVAIVRKRREVLLLDNIRIHLDEVDGLGTFLELEAVVGPDHDAETCRRRVTELLATLGLASADPIRASYGELVLDAR